MQSRQFSSVSPSMPAIRSMLICGNPSDRAMANDRPISGDRCARPFSSRMRSSKFSTPRLRRVTPSLRIAASFASVSVPGSHSNVISSASVQGETAVNRWTSDLSCCVERNDGVPPPKYTKSSFRPAIAGHRRVQLPLPREEIEVRLDFLRVLVGVDAEVAEVAALAAERDVEVQTERDVGRRRRGERGPGVGGHGVGRPDRERRVIGDEVAADLGLLDLGRLGIRGHVFPYYWSGGISAYRMGISLDSLLVAGTEHCRDPPHVGVTRHDDPTRRTTDSANGVRPRCAPSGCTTGVRPQSGVVSHNRGVRPQGPDSDPVELCADPEAYNSNQAPLLTHEDSVNALTTA